MNNETAGARRYQDQVPAVARAVRVLERLATIRGSRALADLARDLDVGPSSLLAILTTLRHAGLVSRTAGGQYRVGPGLAALGSAAARRLSACEQFAEIGAQLVGATGESVLLWLRHDETFVLAASREGTQPLRYVPTPGLRLPAGATGLASLVPSASEVGPASDPAQPAVLDEELLPGVWTVAAALTTDSGERACVAMAGPRDRLATPGAREALLSACHLSDNSAGLLSSERSALASERAGQPAVKATGAVAIGSSALSTVAASGPIDGAELDDFLDQSLVATLSYLADDGYPTTVPLWYTWDGTAFWLASRPGSEWVEHVRLDPRVSLAVSESTPPLRRVLARGRLVEVPDPAGARWSEIEGRLAARYAGFDAAREPATAGRGRLLELRPERLIAWRGLLRHPKLPPVPEGPGTTAWRQLG